MLWEGLSKGQIHVYMLLLKLSLSQALWHLCTGKVKIFVPAVVAFIVHILVASLCHS